MSALNMLAFDYGAGSGRALLGLFDGDRLSLEEIHRLPNGPIELRGSDFWNILALYGELQKGIGSYVRTRGNRLSSIGIDTWGVDFGLLDEQGDLIGNPYHYRGRHSEGMIAEALNRMPRERIYQTTGISFEQYNTLFQLLGLVLRKPHLVERAHTFLLMPDLLAYFLTGEKKTELTNASTTQLLAWRDQKWASGLLDAMGIPRDLFTELEGPFTVRGHLETGLSDELGVGRVPVISVASHDTASAIAAAPIGPGNHAFVSSGTWSLFGVEVTKPFITPQTLRWNYTNELGAGGRTNLMKNIMGMWILDECRREWDLSGLHTGFDDLQEAASRSAPFFCFIDPDDESFYRPGGMVGRIREFCRRTDQEEPQEVGQIVRCVLESLAMKYRWSIERLEQITERSIESLHVVGGGAKNGFLNQAVADAIGRPVRCGPVEATAIGNLLGQAIALGELAGLEQGRELVARSFPTEDFAPAPNAGWDDAFDRFLGVTK
jgi:sugar (pentulose or hexulose) kinase